MNCDHDIECTAAPGIGGWMACSCPDCSKSAERFDEPVENVIAEKALANIAFSHRSSSYLYNLLKYAIEEPSYKRITKAILNDLKPIKNRNIHAAAECVMWHLSPCLPYIYHISNNDSVYIKFQDKRLGSIRISNHSQRNKYKYKWNILVDQGREISRSEYQNSVLRRYYSDDRLATFICDFGEHDKEIKSKPMNFSKLIKNQSIKSPNDLIGKPIQVQINKPTELKEEDGMKTKNVAAMLMDDCKTIGVQFHDGGKMYTYKTTDDFEKGDHAIVFANDEIQVVKVARIDKIPQIDVESNIKYNWVIDKVNFDKYDELMEREDEFNNQLLEIQQQAVKKNAIELLRSALGDNSAKLLDNAISNLNGEKSES